MNTGDGFTYIIQEEENTNYYTAGEEMTGMVTVRDKYRLREYFELPKFLLRYGITDSARVVYSLMLSRTALSLKNGWKDGNGDIYIRYAQEQLARDMGCGITKIKKLLKMLEDAGLIRRRRTAPGGAHIIYLLIPENEIITSGRRDSVARKSEAIADNAENGERTEMPCCGSFESRQLKGQMDYIAQALSPEENPF